MVPTHQSARYSTTVVMQSILFNFIFNPIHYPDPRPSLNPNRNARPTPNGRRRYANLSPLGTGTGNSPTSVLYLQSGCDDDIEQGW